MVTDEANLPELQESRCSSEGLSDLSHLLVVAEKARTFEQGLLNFWTVVDVALNDQISSLFIS